MDTGLNVKENTKRHKKILRTRIQKVIKIVQREEIGLSKTAFKSHHSTRALH
jgi:hypothetical protein